MTAQRPTRAQKLERALEQAERERANLESQLRAALKGLDEAKRESRQQAAWERLEPLAKKYHHLGAALSQMGGELAQLHRAGGYDTENPDYRDGAGPSEKAQRELFNFMRNARKAVETTNGLTEQTKADITAILCEGP